jgi:hypothetical protein
MSKEDKSALLARREGVLELCHNWGTGQTFHLLTPSNSL